MNLNEYIDHTLLAPEATKSEVDEVIKELLITNLSQL